MGKEALIDRTADSTKRQRLEAAGLEDEFESAWRARRAELRTEGVDDPGSTAYQEVLADYLARIPAESVALVDAAVFDGKTAPKPEVVNWVSKNLAIEGVTASAAPSADSWAMLVWARSNPKAFWERMYTALLPVRPTTDDGDRRMGDDLPTAEQYKKTEAMLERITEEAHGGWWKKVEAVLTGDPGAYFALRLRVDQAIAADAWRLIGPGIDAADTVKRKALFAKIKAELGDLIREPQVIEATGGSDPQYNNGRRSRR